MSFESKIRLGHTPKNYNSLLNQIVYICKKDKGEFLLNKTVQNFPKFKFGFKQYLTKNNIPYYETDEYIKIGLVKLYLEEQK